MTFICIEQDLDDTAVVFQVIYLYFNNLLISDNEWVTQLVFQYKVTLTLSHRQVPKIFLAFGFAPNYLCLSK